MYHQKKTNCGIPKKSCDGIWRCDCGLLARPKLKMVAKGISLYITFDPAADLDLACASIFIQNKYNFKFVKNLYGKEAEELYTLLDVEEE